jgi:formyl-CoA transferase
MGWYKGLGTPIKLSRTPGGTRRPPPKFSEHGREVLAQFGYSDTQIAELESNGVLVGKRRV